MSRYNNKIILNKIVIILILIIVILSTLNINVFATTTNVITGRVIDEDTGTGIEGIQAELFSNGILAAGPIQTDSSGVYAFQDVLKGNYTVKFTYGNTVQNLQYNGKDYLCSKITKPANNQKVNIAINAVFILPKNNEDIKNKAKEMISQLDSVSTSVKVGTIKYDSGSSYSVDMTNNLENIIDIENNAPTGKNVLLSAIHLFKEGFCFENTKDVIIILADDNVNSPGNIGGMVKNAYMSNSYMLETLIISETDDIKNTFLNSDGSSIYGKTHSGIDNSTKIVEDICTEIGATLANSIVTFGKEDSRVILDNYLKSLDISQLIALDASIASGDLSIANNIKMSATTYDIQILDNHNNDTTKEINMYLKKRSGTTYSNERQEYQNTGDFITGTAFIDNGNGILDGTETKLTGYRIAVDLIDPNGGVTPGTIKDGEYSFEKPSIPGSYRVKFTYGGYSETAIAGITGQEYIASNAYEEVQTRIDFNARFATFNNKITRLLNAKSNNIVLTDAEIGELISLTNMEAFYDINILQEDLDNDNKKIANLGLVKREDFNINVEKKLSGVRLTLANGQTFTEYVTDDKLNEFNIPTNNIKLPCIIQINEELMHGATIDIEYKIIVENLGSLPLTANKIIDYLDNRNNSIVFKKDTPMITENILETNETYGWDIATAGDIDNLSRTLPVDKQYLVTSYLQPGQKNIVKLVVSKTINSLLEADKLNYTNSAELLEYSNGEGRINIGSNIVGNYYPGSVDENTGEILENDTAVAPVVSIIPPLGEKRIFMARKPEWKI